MIGSGKSDHKIIGTTTIATFIRYVKHITFSRACPSGAFTSYNTGDGAYSTQCIDEARNMRHYILVDKYFDRKEVNHG